MTLSSDNIFEAFFHNSQEGMIIFNLEGKIIHINGRAKDLFGFGRRSPNYNNIETLVGNYRRELQEICDALVVNKKAYGNKLTIPGLAKNGHERLLTLYFNNHIRSAKKSLIAAVVVDETQNEKNKNELRQSQERFRKSFHHNPVAQLVVCTGTDAVIDANRAFLKLSRFLRQDVIGKPLSSVGVNRCHAPNMPAATTGNRIVECEADEFTKDGTAINVIQSYVIIELDNKPYELWTIVDITRRKEAETKLRQINRELDLKVQERTGELAALLEREKSINDMKSRFISTASHEFRTPLTTILISTNLLENYLQKGEKEKCPKHIDRIKSSVNALTVILEDLLLVDKLDQGISNGHASVFDLENFCELTIREITPDLKPGQVIRHEVLAGREIKQDRDLLKHIMLLLLSNASKYSGANQVINWSVTVTNDRLIFTIADSGIGIPAADQSYIFSSFFKAKNAETLGGSGLGLSIAKKYIELLNGTISFTSTENSGTTFVVDIPLDTEAKNGC